MFGPEQAPRPEDENSVPGTEGIEVREEGEEIVMEGTVEQQQARQKLDEALKNTEKEEGQASEGEDTGLDQAA